MVKPRDQDAVPQDVPQDVPALEDQEHIEFMARLRRTINKLDLSEKTADVVDAAADEPAPKGAPADGAGDEKPPKP